MKLFVFLIISAIFGLISATHSAMTTFGEYFLHYEFSRFPQSYYILNSIIWAGVFGFFLIVLRRWHLALAASFATSMSINYSNYQKVINLQEPVLLFDLYKSNVFSALLPFLNFWYISLAAILLTAYFYRFSRKKLTKRENRVNVAAGVLVLFVSLIVIYALGGPYKNEVKNLVGIRQIHWEPLRDARLNGLAVSNAMYINLLTVNPPIFPYTEKAVDSLIGEKLKVKRPLPASASEARQDVVVIMVESLWDPLLSGVPLNKDPMPNLRKFMKSNDQLKLSTPSYGGGTANVEFEALTGIPLATFPAGSTPYQQYVRRPVKSLISTLKASDWHVKAFHNFQRNFWSRNQVYPLLGFHRYLAIDDMNFKKDNKSYYPKDPILYETLLEELKKETTHSRLLFAITVANHQPYNYFDKQDYGDIGTLDSTLEHEHAPLLGYANRLYNADKALGEFLKSIGPNVKILIFGDHHPLISRRYVEGKFDTKGNDLMYQVDAASNFGVFKNISESRPVWCIPSLLLNAIKMEAPPYFQYTGAPCLNNETGSLARLKEFGKSLEVRTLSYDRVLGQGFSYKYARSLE